MAHKQVDETGRFANLPAVSSKKTSGKNISKQALLLTEKPAGEQFKYVAAILEQVQDQVKAVAESLDLTRTEINQKIDGVEKKLSQDIHYTQMAIKAVKDEMDESFEAVDKRFGAMDKRFEAMDKRFEAMDRKMDGVEQRLSEKIDRIGEKVDRHDIDITRLKAAVLPRQV